MKRYFFGAVLTLAFIPSSVFALGIREVSQSNAEKGFRLDVSSKGIAINFLKVGEQITFVDISHKRDFVIYGDGALCVGNNGCSGAPVSILFIKRIKPLNFNGVIGSHDGRTHLFIKTGSTKGSALYQFEMNPVSASGYSVIDIVQDKPKFASTFTPRKRPSAPIAKAPVPIRVSLPKSTLADSETVKPQSNVLSPLPKKTRQPLTVQSSLKKNTARKPVKGVPIKISLEPSLDKKVQDAPTSYLSVQEKSRPNVSLNPNEKTHRNNAKTEDLENKKTIQNSTSNQDSDKIKTKVSIKPDSEIDSNKKSSQINDSDTPNFTNQDIEIVDIKDLPINEVIKTGETALVIAPLKTFSNLDYAQALLKGLHSPQGKKEVGRQSSHYRRAQDLLYILRKDSDISLDAAISQSRLESSVAKALIDYGSRN